MRIKLKTRYAGPDGNFEPGAVIDVDKARAYEFIEQGCAEQIDDGEPVRPAAPEKSMKPRKGAKTAPETATQPPPETGLLLDGPEKTEPPPSSAPAPLSDDPAAP